MKAVWRVSERGPAWKTVEGGARVVTIVYLVSFLPFGSRKSPSHGSVPAHQTVWGPQSVWPAGCTRDRALSRVTDVGPLGEDACFLRGSCLSAGAVRRRQRAPCLALGDVPQSTHTLIATFLPASLPSSRPVPPRVGEPATRPVLRSWAPRRPPSFEGCFFFSSKTMLLTQQPQNNV